MRPWKNLSGARHEVQVKAITYDTGAALSVPTAAVQTIRLTIRKSMSTSSTTMQSIRVATSQLATATNRRPKSPLGWSKAPRFYQASLKRNKKN